MSGKLYGACLIAIAVLSAALIGATALALQGTVKICGRSVSCTGPTPPSGAQAAKFTTLALNSDFTQQMPPNWLGGCAVAGDGQPTFGYFEDDVGHTWWLNAWYFQGLENCNTVQATDPVFGDSVLDMPWVINNYYAPYGTALQSASWDYDNDGSAVCPPSGGTCTGGQGQSNDFPQNSYYEITARISPVQPGAYLVFSTWNPLNMNQASTNPTAIEWDVIETDGLNLQRYDAGLHNWTPDNNGNLIWLGFGPPGIPGNYDPSQYHTFGLRVTSDGTNEVGCSYIDDVFIACVDLPAGFVDNEANMRQHLIVQNTCDWWYYNDQCPGAGQIQHVYVKTIRVWSCASWRTSQCNGPVLTGPRSIPRRGRS
jgi:hypothetical protein